MTDKAKTLITDLRCALPAEGWTDTGCHVHDLRPLTQPSGKWQILDYRSERYAGSLLMTTHPDSAELRIPLSRDGWHAVSIGMVNPWIAHTKVEVRLTGETHWHLIEGFAPTAHELDTAASPLHEEPWLIADLTGRDLEVRYPRNAPRALNDGGYACICSVRMVPVEEQDIPIVKSRRHRMAVHFCGTLFDYDERFDTSQWDVVCGNNSNFSDQMAYPSDVGVLNGKGAWDTMSGRHAHFRWQQEALAAMAVRGEHPLRRAIARAHEHGKKFWLCTRPQLWTAIPPQHQSYRSPFYVAHPEYRCLEGDGTPISKLSIAFPEVREQLSKSLREALEWGADGITVLFNRGYPLVRYEKPVADAFQARYGEDVRAVADSDERLHGVWADFVTEWLQELRNMLDEAGPGLAGTRRELTVFTGPSLEWNLQFGIDVVRWAKDNLVDVVLPYPRHHHTARLYGEIYDKPDGWVDMAGYVAALRGTGTALIPSMGHWGDHGLPLARMRERAHRFYEEGATGVCRWDTDVSLALAQLDDPEIQRLWCDRYRPPQENLMAELGGLNLTEFPPGIGG